MDFWAFGQGKSNSFVYISMFPRCLCRSLGRNEFGFLGGLGGLMIILFQIEKLTFKTSVVLPRCI